MQLEFTRAEITAIIEQLHAITINDSPVFSVACEETDLCVDILLKRPGWSCWIPLPLVEAERVTKQEESVKRARKKRFRV